MRRLILCATLLAACQPLPAPPPTMADCGAAALQAHVGGPLSALPLQAHLRVIHPGDAVTMDYAESRLNAEVDAADRITALRCG